jgi:hypothetical protein
MLDLACRVASFAVEGIGGIGIQGK